MFPKLKFLIGITNSLLYASITVVFGVLVLIGGLLVWIIPSPRWHHFATRQILKIPLGWMDLVNVLIKVNNRHRWDIQGPTSLLHPDRWYVLIANHQSWMDIFVLGFVFNHRVPLLKFFMKKELLWTLPFAGLACWLLDYPFVSRHSRAAIRKNPELKHQDIRAVKKACQKIKEHPTTLVNFVEGSRFSEKKRQQQHSPYHHLLKPKAGGTAIVIHELTDRLAGIINVTLQYHTQHKPMTFWKFSCNDFERISVHYECLPITHDLIGDYYEDRHFRKHFQSWLNTLWKRKDQH